MPEPGKPGVAGYVETFNTMRLTANISDTNLPFARHKEAAAVQRQHME